MREELEGSPGALDAPRSSAGSGLIRRKGHISPLGLTVLTLLACLPLLIAFSRLLALPWGASLPRGSLDSLRSLGESINQSFSLDWVPASDRDKILYLLLLPTAAILVTLTRLTFGIRVLGLRAILIAIGFRAVGFLPSLTLMLIVIGAIIMIRPWFRRIRLPLFARIGVIICMAVMIMIGAVLIAPWIGSETVWSVAFFPVIIIAMLAESVAKTMEKDDVVMAVWRTAWTIVLAMIIALIGGAVSVFSYQFPELILTQLVVIVFIAEFLDLRLLEEWPARLSRCFAGARPWYTARPKVAVVRNRDTAGVIAQLGRPAPAAHAKTSVQPQVDALREQGFEVKVFEGDIGLLSELRQFLPPNPRYGTPGGIVLNLATGVQGDGRFSQVPAMLEMAGLPYTGPDPVAHAHLADRFVLMSLLGRSRVPIPRHFLVLDPDELPDVEFPAAARPRFEPDAGRTVVRNRRSLRRAVQEIRSEYGQPAMVEEMLSGRKFSVFVLGNEQLECLPLVEQTSKKDDKSCPASLGEELANQIRACACAAYRATGCRDYARIEIRLSPFDEPVVTGVKWNTSFEQQDSFVTAAKAGGYTFSALMLRIVSEAAKRYVAGAKAARSTDAAVGSDLERTVAAE